MQTPSGLIWIVAWPLEALMHANSIERLIGSSIYGTEVIVHALRTVHQVGPNRTRLPPRSERNHTKPEKFGVFVREVFHDPS